MSEDSARVFDEDGEQAELVRGKTDDYTVLGDTAGGEVNVEIAESEGGVAGWGLSTRGVAESDTEAGKEFRYSEGFSDVVVGAGIEGGNLVALLAACGDDDDGNACPFAKASGNFHAVEVGQAEVEKDEVGPVI